jgi:transcriptional regulator with XRE-family HTH domain
LNKGRNAIDNHVGSRVRMRRLMLDLSQTQLADGLGLTFQQVQKYEKGTNRISASRLHQLSQILSVPVPFFFEGAPGELHLPECSEGGPTIASDVSALLSTSDGIALVRAYTRKGARREERSNDESCPVREGDKLIRRGVEFAD